MPSTQRMPRRIAADFSRSNSVLTRFGPSAPSPCRRHRDRIRCRTREPGADRFVRFGVPMALRVFHSPVTGAAHFLVQQPACRRLQGGMIGGRPDSWRAVNTDAVSHTGEKHGCSAACRLPRFRASPSHDAMRHEVALVAVAEDMERHDVVGHGGENRAESAAGSPCSITSVRPCASRTGAPVGPGDGGERISEGDQRRGRNCAT